MDLLQKIMEEKARQDEKWDQQDRHPKEVLRFLQATAKTKDQKKLAARTVSLIMRAELPVPDMWVNARGDTVGYWLLPGFVATLTCSEPNDAHLASIRQTSDNQKYAERVFSMASGAADLGDWFRSRFEEFGGDRNVLRSPASAD